MKLLAVLWASALLASVVGQTASPPRAPGGQGGQRQGGMSFRGGGTRLLLNPAVQKELKMSKAQTDKAQKSFGSPSAPGGQPGQGRGGAQGGGQSGQRMTDEQREQRRLEVEKQVKGILDAKQFARYSQIVLQSQGASALTRKDVAAKVGLSSVQVTKIQDIQRKQMEAMRAQFQRGQQGGAGAGGGDIRAQFMKMRAETDKKILATLSAAQKQKWTTMLGAPFKFQ